jgi:peptidoglycan/LPS O-acetylase OafA/YrhL
MYTTGNGVFLFFALSGYLLFLPFARHYWGDLARPKLGRYFLNRAVRILPLYYAATIVYLIVFGATISQWAHFTTFTQDFYSTSFMRFDGPMWSVVAEVFFYLALPVVAWALGTASRRSIPSGFLLLAGLGFVLYVVRGHLDATGDRLWDYSPLTNAMFFVPGMALALFECANPRRWLVKLPEIAKRSDVWICAGVAVWAYHAYVFPRHDELLAVASLLVLGGCALPFRDGLAVRCLEWRPLALLGIASYSLYIWHDPIVKALSSIVPGGFVGLLAVSLVACIAVSAVSYLMVERPFLELRRSWSAGTSSRMKKEGRSAREWRVDVGSP